MFLTGTAAAITLVRDIDHRKVGRGEAGPVTAKVQQVFQATLHGREPRYRDWLYYI